MKTNKYIEAIANIALCCASDSELLAVIKKDLDTVQELVDMHENPINKWEEFKAFEWYYDKKHDEYVQFIYDNYFGNFYLLAPCYAVYDKEFEQDRFYKYQPLEVEEHKHVA